MDKEAEQQQISTLYCTLYPYMYIRILRVTAGLSILSSGLHTYFLFLFVNIVVRDLPTKCGPYLVVEISMVEKLWCIAKRHTSTYAYSQLNVEEPVVIRTSEMRLIWRGPIEICFSA